MVETLKKRIETKKAVVGIVGLGYVGLPLAIAFAEEEFTVYGLDIDKEKVEKLRNGESYIKHISKDKIKELRERKVFYPTDDFSKIKEIDAVLICVPTPLDEHLNPDLSFVINTAETISKYLRKGHLVVLESSTYPGTTEEIVKPILEKSGLVCHRDFFLAYSPEREDPNNPEYTTKTIPKVVGASSSSSLEVAKALYDQVVVKTVPVSSSQVAEATKIFENVFRSVNIALVNETKQIFTKMGIDIWEVIKAASTKPFGFMPFYPGPGLGGHCIPIDPFYLTYRAKEYGISTRFIELAGEINRSMPEWVVYRVMDALNEKKKSLNGSKILILGVAYKKNVDDMRESPALELMRILSEKGAEVDYSDPYIPELPPTRRYRFKKKSIDLTEKNLSSYDAVIIVTDHDAFNYEKIVKYSNLIVDTRNATKNIKEGREKIRKA